MILQSNQELKKQFDIEFDDLFQRHGVKPAFKEDTKEGLKESLDNERRSNRFFEEKMKDVYSGLKIDLVKVIDERNTYATISANKDDIIKSLEHSVRLFIDQTIKSVQDTINNHSKEIR